MAWTKIGSRNTSLRRLIDEKAFANPWTALTVMIFLQARDDAAYLKKVNKQRTDCVDHSHISKWELLNFVRSDWGQMLAAYIGVSEPELKVLESYVMEC